MAKFINIPQCIQVSHSQHKLGATLLLLIHCVSKKNRTPVTYTNNSNNPRSMLKKFGTKHRRLINT